jgi:hypothetical protein
MDITTERGTSSEEFGKAAPELIPQLWPQLAKLIEEKTDWLELSSLEEMYTAMVNNFVDVWVALEGTELQGFVICQWERYPKRSYYNIIAIAGDGLDLYLREGLEKIERFAALIGAYEVVLQGRFGWMRKLEKFGYKQTRVQLRKNVNLNWRN